MHAEHNSSIRSPQFDPNESSVKQSTGKQNHRLEYLALSTVVYSIDVEQNRIPLDIIEMSLQDPFANV